MNWKNRNNRIFELGQEVYYQGRKHTILAGSIMDYHGINYYWLQDIQESIPVSVSAGDIFIFDE